MKRRRFLSLAAAFACAPRFARAAAWRGVALGAEVSVHLSGPRAETAPALATIPELLAHIERRFSLYESASDLSRLNATGRLDAPDATFLDLMAQAEHAHGLSGGLFDPTVQPLWRALATGDATASARHLIGWNKLRFGADGVILEPGQALTFNGIAQGFATDLVRDWLAARGFAKALVNIGEYGALGGPWRVGIADPASGIVGLHTLEGTAIATSSPGALMLGKTGHILSPDGRPPMWSTISIEADTAALADALSTAAVFMDRAALADLKRAAALRRIIAVDGDGNVLTI